MYIFILYFKSNKRVKGFCTECSITVPRPYVHLLQKHKMAPGKNLEEKAEELRKKDKNKKVIKHFGNENESVHLTMIS